MSAGAAPPAGDDPEVTVTVPRDEEVIIERTFAAPPERVFAAFVEPRLIARWWGPREWVTIVDTLDLRPGGRFHITFRGPGGEHPEWTGEYREIVPGRRLVRTLEYSEFPGYVLVETVTFARRGTGTHVTLATRFPTPANPDFTAAGIRPGLRRTFARLREFLEPAEGA